MGGSAGDDELRGLPENLIEAELFGHEAGSFTGAAKTRHGRFEEADGGTLFLDELATLSSPAQDRLLRAVEYGEITRIGASKPIQVDVRIVAATNEHLPRLVEEGRFRADLLDRLSFEVVTLASASGSQGRYLAARRAFRSAHGSGARLAQLAGLFEPRRGGARRLMPGRATSVSSGTSSSGRSIERKIRNGQIDEIQFDPFTSPWVLNPDPAGAVEVAAYAAHPQPAASELAAVTAAPPASTNDLRGAVNAYEKALLEEALAKNRFNQRTTASALGLSYDQLRHAMKRHQLAVSN